MYKYSIIIEPIENGYSAYIPELPGCIATGPTKAETQKSILEAMNFHLEGMGKEEALENEIRILTLNPELNKYHGVNLFPEKVGKANEMLRKSGVPKFGNE